MRFLAPSASILVLASSVLAGPVDVNPVDASLLNASFTDVGFFNASSTDTTPRKYDPTCYRFRQLIRFYYKLAIPCTPKDDPPEEICKRLWKELKDQSSCDVTSPHGCNFVDGTDSSVEWWFHASTFCKTQKVERAFAKATHDNKYGKIFCQKI